MLKHITLSSALIALTACGPALQEETSKTLSLTGPDYNGKKYYLGWGAAASGDPSSMHNEVKFDVQHTHDIFANDVGGGYVGTKLIGPQVATGAAIRSNWTSLTAAMKPEDMYVQYSSGHGSRTGLAVGVSYDQMRDAALAMPASEIVIFTMACYSGNLVNSFNARKADWEKFQDQGRTLLVMASSKASETSSTGPGTDPDEPNQPRGSAGSAFGHALWKSLIGYADGHLDGVKDGFISLEEIVKYSEARTKKIGGHTPVYTGVYNPNILMNRVPPKAFVEALENTTEGMSDEQVAQLVQQLDQETRL